jgi:hypothetical protein
VDEQIVNAKRDDPFDYHRWPLAQAAAWIIWRSRAYVAQLLSDITDSEGRVQVFDIFNEAVRRENGRGGPPEGDVLPFAEAQAELWEQLRQGRLAAMGVKVGEATWSYIPASEWLNLDYFPCTDGRSNSIGSNHSIVYDEVTVPRSALLEIWPDTTKVKARRKRGRKPRIPQEEVDEVVFELFEENGDLSDDDPNWHTQGQVERATRAGLEKKFGKKTVPQESTFRTYIVKSLNKWELFKAGN